MDIKVDRQKNKHGFSSRLDLQISLCHKSTFAQVSNDVRLFVVASYPPVSLTSPRLGNAVAVETCPSH
jgi:hypothetical protein